MTEEVKKRYEVRNTQASPWFITGGQVADVSGSQWRSNGRMHACDDLVEAKDVAHRARNQTKQRHVVIDCVSGEEVHEEPSID